MQRGSSTPRVVFVTGGTGYLGHPLIGHLLSRGHTVRALVRPGSQGRLPAGTVAVPGDALDAASFAGGVAPADTFVQLVGTPKPSPAKAKEFQRVDLGSALASVEAAKRAGVRHFVYVSVAHPAPVMRAYVEARVAAEARIRAEFDVAGLGATILRPWYVLGPGHRWAHLLQPMYAVAHLVPGLRAGAERLGLVSRAQMLGALVAAVDAPHERISVIDVAGIRRVMPAPQSSRRVDSRIQRHR